MQLEQNPKDGTLDDDELFQKAVSLVAESRQASASLLQRRLRIGYGQAARIIDEMEAKGLISSADGTAPRKVLVTGSRDTSR
jgi:S-DNA-T family DNA segregation ATPase FtsK/SpoIIIE